MKSQTSYPAVLRLLALALVIGLYPLQSAAQYVGKELNHEESPNKPKKKIMILAVFHFASSADRIKTKLDDMMSEQRQEEIAELNESLLPYAPDKIFVEWQPDRQKRVDSLYAEYRKGAFALKANEVYQIGFRLANALDLSTVHCMDASGYYLYDTLMTTAKKYGQYEHFERFADSVMAAVMLQDSLSNYLPIKEKLLQMNSREWIMQSHLLNAGVTSAAYLGAPGEYAGAEFMGEWYKRNIRMYSNIARLVSDTDERILVIVGAGHVRILMHFFEDHPEFELIDATAYLK